MKNFIPIIAYLLFSVNLIAQNVLLTENFSTYDGTAGTTPAGWTFSNHAIYTSTGYSGPSGPNAYKFSVTNAEVITPEFPDIADSLIFWLRGSSTDSLSSFLIEQYNKTNLTYDTLTIIQPIISSGKIYRLPLYSGISMIRFTYFKSAGNVAFDDFSVTTTSSVDFTPPVITLLGQSEITIFTGTIFNDPGATATDNVDGDISGNIVTTGLVNSDSAGTYSLFYNVADSTGNKASEVSRIVNVIDSDTLAPVITLSGANPLNITVGGNYIEPGASATDNMDGDLSSLINISGTVNSGVTGNYQIVYTVSDNSGNIAEVTRFVNVYSTPGISCSYPFFSEYIDPVSGSTKVLEIYNPTGFTIDLSEYVLHKFTNGALTSTTLTLSGNLQSGNTFIIAHSLADSTVLSISNMQSSFLTFNGDDALLLMKGSDTLDIIGRIGQDPGSEWTNTDTSISTANMTLRRLQSVQTGIISNPSSFDPSSQWQAFAWDDYSGLGNHQVDSCATALCPAITINFSKIDASCNNSTDGSITIDTVGAGGVSPFMLSINGGSFQSELSFTGLNANSYTIDMKDANACTAPQKVITITSPAVVDAGSDRDFCKTQVFKVKLTGSPFGGTWTGSAGVVLLPGDTLDVVNTPWTVISGIPHNLIYTVGACSDTANLIVTGAVAGSDIDYCLSSGIFTLPLASPAGGTWSGPGITNAVTGQVDPTGLSGPITYTYTHTGCPDQIIVNYTPALGTPIVSCGISTTISITWTWTAVTGATSYEVNFGFGWSPASGLLTHTEVGKNPGDKMSIQVRAVRTGTCPEVGPASTPVECEPTGCKPITIGLLPDVTVCPGANATVGLFSITRPDGMGKFIWTWSGDPALIDNKPGPFTVNTPVTKTYFITVTDTSQLGCPTVMDSTIVTVIKANKFTNQDSVAVCDDTPYTPNFDASNFNSITWSPGTSLSCTVCANPTINPVPALNDCYQYQITVIDKINGCTGVDTFEICRTSSIIAEAGADTVRLCIEEGAPSINYTLDGTASTAQTLRWVSGNPLMDVASSTAPVFLQVPDKNNPPFYNFTLIGSSPGCTNDTDRIVVTFYQYAKPNGGTDKTTCGGDVQLSVLQGYVTNSWYSITPGASVKNQTNPLNPLVTPSLSTNPSLFVFQSTNGNGCNSTDTVTVTLMSLTPTLTVTPSLSVCEGDSFKLKATGGAYYQFFEDNTSLGPSSQLDNLLLIAGVTHQYKVTATAPGCAPVTTSGLTVTVKSLPLAAFNFSSSELTVTFMDSSTGATNYLWSFGDGGTDSVPSPVYTYSAEGEYTVGLEVSNDCGSDSVLKLVTVKSTKTENLLKQGNDGFVLYPVPASDKLIIQSEKPETIEEITLFNIHGKKEKTVRVNSLVNNNSRKNIEVSLTGIPAGSYIIRIKSKDGSEWKRLVAVVR